MPLIDERFVLVGVAIVSVGHVLCIRDTVKGRTQPNRVTFLVWAIAPMLAFAVEMNAGVGVRSLMTLSVGLGPLFVFTASFWNRCAAWKLGALDYTCGALAGIGLAGWLVTDRGSVALIAAIISDGLAALPTFVKAWRAPETETPALYIASVLNAAIAVAAAPSSTFIDVGFPLYIFALGATMVTLTIRRRGAHTWHRTRL